MASTTTNLGLTKPAYSDDADISDINGNMDLIDAEAGKVRANVAENYDSSETYAVGDYCLHDGSLYKCSTAISSPEAWTAGHWTQIKITGELSTLNGNLTSLSDQIVTNSPTVSFVKFNSDGRTRISRFGNLCVLDIAGYTASNFASEDVVLTIPDDVAPSNEQHGIIKRSSGTEVNSAYITKNTSTNKYTNVNFNTGSTSGTHWFFGELVWVIGK